MFYIEVAKLLIQVNNRYDKISQKCKDYLCEPYREPDLVIEADEQLIAYGLKLFWERGHIEATKGDAEASLAPHNIYGQLPLFGALWLHAVLLEMDGEGYMVTAPSGYGKTTQARLWLKAFPDRARIINGDNPIVRKDGDGFVAYGTPFCGKEGYQVNTSVPLKGLCYLKHGETNAIQRMDSSLAFAQLLREYQHRFTPENQEKYMEMLQQFVETVPIYVLTCNLDGQAPIVAYEGLKHGGN